MCFADWRRDKLSSFAGYIQSVKWIESVKVPLKVGEGSYFRSEIRTCWSAGCLFLTLVARCNRTSVSRCVVPTKLAISAGGSRSWPVLAQQMSAVTGSLAERSRPWDG